MLQTIELLESIPKTAGNLSRLLVFGILFQMTYLVNILIGKKQYLTIIDIIPSHKERSGFTCFWENVLRNRTSSPLRLYYTQHISTNRFEAPANIQYGIQIVGGKQSLASPITPIRSIILLH